MDNYHDFLGESTQSFSRSTPEESLEPELSQPKSEHTLVCRPHDDELGGLRRLAQQIVDAMLGQVAIADADWTIVAANAAWLAEIAKPHIDGRLDIGRDYKAFCEWSREIGFPPAERMLAAIEEIEQGRSRRFVTIYASKISPGKYFQMRVSRLEIGGTSYVTISRIDMSELFALRRERQRLRATLRNVQEAERQHLARDLHDSAGHFMAGMSLGLMHLRQISRSHAVLDVANELSGLLERFQRDIRGIAYLLNPPELQHGNLYESICALCSGFAARSGLEMEFHFHGASRQRSAAVEATIYRIVQEALSNIYKHAFARRVRLRFSVMQGKQLIFIDDDGVGLSETLNRASNDALLGVGIRGMIARAAELGGRLKVHKRKSGRGTVVVAVLPLHAGSGFRTAA